MSKVYVVPQAFVTYLVKPQQETMKLEGKTFTLALPDCATPTIDWGRRQDLNLRPRAPNVIPSSICGLISLSVYNTRFMRAVTRNY